MEYTEHDLWMEYLRGVEDGKEEGYDKGYADGFKEGTEYGEDMWRTFK